MDTNPNPFVREGDGSYNIAMAEIYFTLVNIRKIWRQRSRPDSEVRITSVIFRHGSHPWSRMDITFSENDKETRTVVGEFLEFYFPEGGELFDANQLFKKVEQHYGVEYIERLTED